MHLDEKVGLEPLLSAIEGLVGNGLEIEAGADLSRLNTFRIGGPAELMVEVGTERALSELMAEVYRRGAPFHLLGLGSNVLVPDDGLPGVVARLAGEFKQVEIDRPRVRAGGAVTLAQIARRTAASGLTGLEPLSGFPSTVGGAVCMNAGCYGTEITDLLEVVRIVDREGVARELEPGELKAGYRSSVLQQTGEIVTIATFRLVPGDASAALARIDQLNKKRWESLPSGRPNVGSIFKNPEGDYAGRLIEECRLKGVEVGGAQISPKHGNVIVNLGAARAADVLDLMVMARREVEARFDIALRPEVVLAGSLRDQWLRRTGSDSPHTKNARTASGSDL